MKLSAAGNTEVPAYLVLKEMGFKISVIEIESSEQLWTAQKQGLELNGASPLELLGLAQLVQCRGTNWRANDKEIDDFVTRYC